MNEARLRELLAEIPVPDAENAERRGLLVVREAFAQRRPQRHRPRLARLAIALAVAAVVGALLLSPAGAAVRGWIGDTFDAGMPNAERGLAEIPGGGRLLVESRSGPWVVEADGSRRLLGHYREATWSPRGLFVAVAAGRTLSAVEPDGTPRWSLDARGRISDPRWSPFRFRIAYRSGRTLRVTTADGSADHLVAPRTRPPAPAWSPLASYQLAYVSGDGELRIADSESGTTLASARALSGVRKLEWGGDGVLLEASRRALWTRPTALPDPGGTVRIGSPHRLSIPDGDGHVRDAALSPSGRSVAVLLGVHGPRSDVLLYPAAGGRPRRLLSVPGRLGQIAWAPDGSRLLVTWPGADQWLFLPRSGEGRALAGVAAAFAPGHSSAAFPRVEGWCCHAR
jgi:hypothetical protein